MSKPKILDCIVLRYKNSYKSPSFKASRKITLRPFFQKGDNVQDADIAILNEDWQYGDKTLFHVSLKNKSDENIPLTKMKFDFGSGKAEKVYFGQYVTKPDSAIFNMEKDNLPPSGMQTIKIVCDGDDFKDIEISADGYEIRITGQDVIYGDLQLQDI